MLTACLICFLSAVSACGPDIPAVSSATLRVRDFRNKEVALQAPAERIVCLIESALSGLYMLGAGSRVIGVSTNIYATPVHRFYAAMDERIAGHSLPSPGNWDFVSAESVIALRPDLVIIWAQQKEAIESLEEKGITVYAVMLHSFDDVCDEIRSLGALTGTPERAAEIIRYSKNEIKGVIERLKKTRTDPTPKVYYMWAQGMLETSGKKSTVNDVIELAGGRNLFHDVDMEHMTVNMESVIARNPDIIIMWQNDRMDPADITKDPRWKTASAVKNLRVHEFPEVFLCDLWTLKYPHAVKMAAKWFHPEAFRNMDLESEKKKMLGFLYPGMKSP